MESAVTRSVGVGRYQKCAFPSCLKAGDVVELGIDSLGESRQKLLA